MHRRASPQSSHWDQAPHSPWDCTGLLCGTDQTQWIVEGESHEDISSVGLEFKSLQASCGVMSLLCHAPVVGSPPRTTRADSCGCCCQIPCPFKRDEVICLRNHLAPRQSQELSATEGWDASPWRGCHRSANRWDPDGTGRGAVQDPRRRLGVAGKAMKTRGQRAGGIAIPLPPSELNGASGLGTVLLRGHRLERGSCHGMSYGISVPPSSPSIRLHRAGISSSPARGPAPPAGWLSSSLAVAAAAEPERRVAVWRGAHEVREVTSGKPAHRAQRGAPSEHTAWRGDVLLLVCPGNGLSIPGPAGGFSLCC